MAESDGSTKPPRIPRVLILLVGLTPLLLSGALTAPFLDFDDVEHVAAPVVLGIKPWYSVFELTSGSIFPLTILSFKAERMFFLNTLGIQNWAPFSRIDNLILHAIAGILIWYILRALKFSTSWTTLITGAFLFHPMVCESVCWVSERKNVLAAAFGFGAIYLSLSRSAWRSPGIITLYLLALLSKPSALGLLPTLLVLQVPYVRQKILADDAPQEPSEKPEPNLSPVLMIALVAGALGSVAFNLKSHSQMIMKPPGGSVFTALLTDVEVFRRYMQNLLVPNELSAAYAVKPILSIVDPRFLMNAALVGGFIVVTLWLSRRRALSAFLWFWFFAGLGPVMNLVATMLLMQDRYVYLSSPAFFAITALALHGLLSRARTDLRDLPRVAALGIPLLLLSDAVVRSFDWQTTYTLYRDAVEKQPQSAFAQINFGLALIKGADYLAQNGGKADEVEALRAEAAKHLETACMLEDQERLVSPGKPYTALALLQFERGKLDEAESLCRRVLQENFTRPVTFPNKIEVRVLLARIYLKQDRPADALTEANEAIKVGTRNDYIAGDAYFLAGQALEKLNRVDEATGAYEKLVEGMPDYNAAKARLVELKK